MIKEKERELAVREAKLLQEQVALERQRKLAKNVTITVQEPSITYQEYRITESSVANPIVSMTSSDLSQSMI